jgi:hypothetical protein
MALIGLAVVLAIVAAAAGLWLVVGVAVFVCIGQLVELRARATRERRG